MRKWIIGAVAVIVIGVIAYFALGSGGGGLAGEEPTPIPDVLPPVTASDSVVAEGEVVPVRNVELRFETGGTIDEVLVVEGDTVDEDDLLSRLDTSDLALEVEDARAQLAQARADYEQLLDGATPDEVDASQADIAAAEAQLARAEAQLAQRQATIAQREADVARNAGELQRVRGQVTEADIAAARADIVDAQTELERLEALPKAVDVQVARAEVNRLQANLQNQRDSLSAAKNEAESDLELAANDLRNAQQNYSSVYWEVREIERELNTVDQQIWQDLKDREESALREVRNREEQVHQSELAVEAARRAEITGIQQAEAQLAQAQAELEDLLEGAEEAELAAARARVANAQANLQSLTGDERAGNLASAAANVSAAQANVSAAQADANASQADIESAQATLARRQAELEDLTAAPRQPEIDDREALILQREVNLRRAERNLEKASLFTPMSGTVVEVDLEEGERITNEQVAIRIADFSEWEIETTDLTELGVVRIEIGDPAVVTFDAIPELEIEGIVQSIQDIGKNQQGDIVYKVTITPTEWDDRLRWGMTATVSIEPEADQQTGTGASEAESSSDSTDE
jgi:HlyD family secretion protein